MAKGVVFLFGSYSPPSFAADPQGEPYVDSGEKEMVGGEAAHDGQCGGVLHEMPRLRPVHAHLDSDVR